MLDNRSLLKEISLCLYRHIEGEGDKDLPVDEYDYEAELLLERIPEDRQPSSQEIAKLLSEIFSETFDDSYPREEFVNDSEEISKILKRYSK